MCKMYEFTLQACLSISANLLMSNISFFSFFGGVGLGNMIDVPSRLSLVASLVNPSLVCSRMMAAPSA